MSRRTLTLLEVLVAMVVCGAGISVVALGISTSIRAESRAGQLDRAAAHLELLSTRLVSEQLELQDGAGDFTDDGTPELRWSVALQGTDREGLQRATIAVTWDTVSGEQSLTVERMVFVDPLVGGVQ